MTTTVIREKLYDYIRVADEKKLKAIYWMLEDDLAERSQWWKDREFTDELNREFEAWKKGKEKAYTKADIEATVALMKQKRSAK
jgi:hypothetical protein